MGLTHKILLFTSALIVALVGVTLAFTTVQADRLARNTIREGLRETRQVWEALQADRFSKLKLGVRVLANDPAFKAALAERDQATTLNTLGERGQDLGADFMLATDPAGFVMARTDRAGAAGQELASDPIVQKALEGEESATVWREGERLSTVVAVPMQVGTELIGVLVSGYVIDEAVAGQVRRLTRSEVAYLAQGPGETPRLVASSLGSREAPLVEALSRSEVASGTDPFEVDLGGDRHIGVRIPLRTAAGQEIGSVLALQSLAAETAAFRQFRNGLVLASLGVMALALALAYVASKRITGPVRTLVTLVERVREGAFTGAVTVQSRDEIGVLARAFNALLTDLREKDQMIQFLREGMSAMGAKATLAGRSFAVGATEALRSSPTTAALDRGQIFDGRYEILAPVGKGGMGVVYCARDRQLDEVVALKLLRPEALASDPSLLDRFKQEIKLARRITHRNVLRTHDFGEATGTPYISMEYLEGVTLKELVRNRGALPLAVGLSIAKQMCHGLGAAHETGVVHRDIKPQNMLILPETGDLKIMDFGIARVSTVEGGAAGLTIAGTVMGTPDYIPPEQAQGRPADFRSDIYSLGVVLFEIFTGTLPFPGESVMAVVMGHIQRPPPRPRASNPSLPEGLETAILRCLEKNPAQRFASVDELLEALTSVSSRARAAA